MSQDKQTQGHRLLTARLFVMVLAMFSFGYALVPLYDMFCDLTGLGGRTNTVAATSVNFAPDPTRTVTIEFISTVNRGAPWEFRPEVNSVTVHPGEMNDAIFYAKNLSGADMVGQAIPSITPGKAAGYFIKTECFCFEQQSFTGGEEKDMNVRFVVDPELPEYIDTITLSYTLFNAQQVAALK